MAEDVKETELTAEQREMMRRYEAIVKFKRDYWIERTGVYDEDDLQDVEFEVIREDIWVHEIEDFDVDAHWAQGWTNEDYNFQREDSMEHTDCVTHRVFPTRYRLKDFRLTKSLRRVLNKNRDLKMIVRPFRITPAKEALFIKHEQQYGYKTIWKTLLGYYPMGDDTPTKLMETAVFCGEKLIAFSVFQLAKYSVFSDRCCWDGGFWKRSPGILTVLLEMQYAARKGFKYYYMAHYGRHSRLFQYKTRFPALELYDWDNDRWIDYKTPEAHQLLDQKLNYYYEKKDLEHYCILFNVVSYCEKDITASAVVGSQAGDAPSEGAVIEVVVLTPNVENYVTDETAQWAKQFGSLREQKIEERGKNKIIRAFYKNGQEIEFNFVPPDWAETEPIAEDTRRVVQSGIKIMHDPDGILEKLQTAVSAAASK